ncbi:MAG: hypothetical protein WEA77_02020 [Hyphomonas sp.]|uniref:hypothetical protein n=1 Tax=Hyphomonas sp. TaxID=87 RepID=UPI0034A09201
MGHRITVTASGPYGGSSSAVAEAIFQTVTDIHARGGDGAEQTGFSASHTGMGWMMPVTVSPGGPTSTSVRLTAGGAATIFAKFSGKMGNLLGTAQPMVRAVPDNSSSQSPDVMASLMNARMADILKRNGRKP